jgi:aldehyde dehydrogenase
MLEKTNSERSNELNVKHLGIDFPFKSRYGNVINGKFQAPKAGRYFDNHTPITGEFLCEVARSDSSDVESAHSSHGVRVLLHIAPKF